MKPPTIEEMQRIGQALKALDFGVPPDAELIRANIEVFIRRWAPKGKRDQFRQDFQVLAQEMGGLVGFQVSQTLWPQFQAMLPRLIEAIRTGETIDEPLQPTEGIVQ